MAAKTKPSSPSFTPGPRIVGSEWRVKITGKSPYRTVAVVAGPSNAEIAVITQQWKPELVENHARLIASAPATLRELAELIDFLVDKAGEGEAALLPENDPIIESARSIIQAATGEEE